MKKLINAGTYQETSKHLQVK
ncbi:MAG: hypothetical protein J6J18_12140 [Oscillospiraceae bacterium]|nr:hypothetical protein [Oscillospiraceae bacterium]